MPCDRFLQSMCGRNEQMLTLGLTAALDGEIEKPINEDGSVFFELKSGAHILGVFNGRKLMYSVTIICI